MNNKLSNLLKTRNMKTFVTTITDVFSDRIVFEFLQNGEYKNVSYSEFYKDINALGTVFLNKKINNKRIAILCENSYEWLVIYFASILSSNIVIPLERNLNRDDYKWYLNDSETDILFYSKTYSYLNDDELDYDNIKTICVSEFYELLHQGNELLLKNDKTFVNHKVDEHALCQIVYTSGTTSEPKGILLSQSNLTADVIGAVMNVTAAGSVVQVLPFHHMFSLVTLMAEMYYGMKIFINNSLTEYIEDIKRIKPTLLVVVPAFLELFCKQIKLVIHNQFLLDKSHTNKSLYEIIQFLSEAELKTLIGNVKSYFGGNLNEIICGGAFVEPEYVDIFEIFGVKVLVGYGLTECVSIVSVNKNNLLKRDSVGLKIPTCDIKILDPNDEGIGEIVVKGETVMLSYKNYEDNDEVFTKDGWLKTGDLGWINETGFLHVVGRKKNLIILNNGKNVSAEELETLIAKITAVKEVIVYQNNNSICAEIFPNYEIDDAERIIRDGIKALNRKLPLYKNISNIYLTNAEFQKTPTQKIKRINHNSNSTFLSVNCHDISINEYDHYLKSLWSDILGVSKDSITNDVSFFELGGDSISAYMMFDKIQKKYNEIVTVNELITCRTIDDILNLLKKNHCLNIQNSDRGYNQESKCVNSDISVTGIGFLLPKATSNEEYWNLLSGNSNTFKKISPKRKQLYNIVEWDQWISELYNIDEFDYDFFNVSKEEALFMEPHLRLIMRVAHVALEDAGEISDAKLRKNIGVFSSLNTPAYQNIIRDYIDKNGINETHSKIIANNQSNVISSQIAHRYNFVGCAMSIDTACSSFLTALHIAKEKIKLGELEGALIVASNIISEPLMFDLLEKEGLLSKNGVVNLFDSKSSGMVIGEGVIAIYIESLNKAKEYKKNIYGIIKGSAINHNGMGLSVTAANPQGQIEVMKMAYKNAGISPCDVSYVEVAGTGTYIGDQIEFQSHINCFKNVKDKSVAIGSVKSYIGNTMTVSSAAGLIKILLCLKYKKLLPSFCQNDSDIKTEQTPFYFIENEMEWKCDKNKKRIAAIFSTGIGGSNAYALIEEWNPKIISEDNAYKSSQLLVISARDEVALGKTIETMNQLIKENDYDHLQNICFTSCHYRSSYSYRAACIIKSNNEPLNWKYGNDKKIKNINLIIKQNSNDLKHQKLNTLIECFEKTIENLNIVKFSSNLEYERFLSEKSNSDIKSVNELFITYGFNNALFGKLNIVALENICELSEEYENILLQVCMNLYLLGCKINWHGIYPIEKCNMLSLPPYPLKNNSVWLNNN